MTHHLYRSRDDRMLAGVAGGLAERWDADPSLVRLVWALLMVFTAGTALVVYIVMAIVVPEEDDMLPQPSPAPTSAMSGSAPAAPPGANDATPGATAPAPGLPAAPPVSYWVPGSVNSRAEARAARRAARRQRGDTAAPAVIGACLVILGGFFLAREWLPELDWDWFWPLMLIGLGVLLLVLAIGRRPTDPGATS